MTHDPDNGAGLPPLELPVRRLTLSQTVEKLIAALARSSNEHSSVRLTRNAKGDTQIEVMVRTGEAGVETIEDAALSARMKYDELRGLYPIGNGVDS